MRRPGAGAGYPTGLRPGEGCGIDRGRVRPAALTRCQDIASHPPVAAGADSPRYRGNGLVPYVPSCFTASSHSRFLRRGRCCPRRGLRLPAAPCPDVEVVSARGTGEAPGLGDNSRHVNGSRLRQHVLHSGRLFPGRQSHRHRPRHPNATGLRPRHSRGARRSRQAVVFGDPVCGNGGNDAAHLTYPSTAVSGKGRDSPPSGSIRGEPPTGKVSTAPRRARRVHPRRGSVSSGRDFGSRLRRITCTGSRTR